MYLELASILSYKTNRFHRRSKIYNTDHYEDLFLFQECYSRKDEKSIFTRMANDFTSNLWGMIRKMKQQVEVFT